MARVAYIYGQPGCGKTRMLHDVFDKVTTCVGTIGFGEDFMVHYAFTSSDVFALETYLSSLELSVSENLFVVLCCNEQPDDINIHMDHIFCIKKREDLAKARKFFEYITTDVRSFK